MKPIAIASQVALSVIVAGSTSVRRAEYGDVQIHPSPNVTPNNNVANIENVIVDRKCVVSGNRHFTSSIVNIVFLFPDMIGERVIIREDRIIITESHEKEQMKTIKEMHTSKAS